MNQTFSPRTIDRATLPTIRILWMNNGIEPEDVGSTELWTPNHFVPLLKSKALKPTTSTITIDRKKKRMKIAEKSNQRILLFDQTKFLSTDAKLNEKVIVDVLLDDIEKVLHVFDETCSRANMEKIVKKQLKRVASNNKVKKQHSKIGEIIYQTQTTFTLPVEQNNNFGDTEKKRQPPAAWLQPNFVHLFDLINVDSERNLNETASRKADSSS
ncbi:unnamed protein product, partial [Didymodactylos carnosus]